MNARLSPVCFGLLKYRVMVKGCPRLTVNSVLAYLSVWCVPAFADGCQLICVGVRSVKQRTRREAAASNSFAGKWRDEVAKNSYLLPEQGQLKCRCSIKLVKTSGLVTEIIACTLFRGCPVLKAFVLPVQCWMLLYHRTWEKKNYRDKSAISLSAPNKAACSPSNIFNTFIFRIPEIPIRKLYFSCLRPDAV